MRDDDTKAETEQRQNEITSSQFKRDDDEPYAYETFVFFSKRPQKMLRLEYRIGKNNVACHSILSLLQVCTRRSSKVFFFFLGGFKINQIKNKNVFTIGLNETKIRFRSDDIRPPSSFGNMYKMRTCIVQ